MKRIFKFSKINIYLFLWFLPNFLRFSNVYRSWKSQIKCQVSCVTCHISLTPTAKATDPTFARPQTKMSLFLRGNLRPLLSKFLNFWNHSDLSTFPNEIILYLVSESKTSVNGKRKAVLKIHDMKIPLFHQSCCNFLNDNAVLIYFEIWNPLDIYFLKLFFDGTGTP